MGMDVEGGNVEHEKKKKVETGKGGEPITVYLWEENWEEKAFEAWQKMWKKNGERFVRIWGGWTPNPKIYRAWGRALEVLRVERRKLRERGERNKAFAIFS